MKISMNVNVSVAISEITINKASSQGVSDLHIHANKDSFGFGYEQNGVHKHYKFTPSRFTNRTDIEFCDDGLVTHTSSVRNISEIIDFFEPNSFQIAMYMDLEQARKN